jgi:hypothetical protein
VTQFANDRELLPQTKGDAMNWEQIESKWQAMARRIRADHRDTKAPMTRTTRTDTTRPDRPADETPKSDTGAAA